MSQSSLLGRVKGGGRLYSEPPLAGYTEEEMVAEAQQRHAHNRQRRRLKQLLNAASEDGSTVATKDLLLAAKLAKLDLPEEMVADTPYAMGMDAIGERALLTSPLPSTPTTRMFERAARQDSFLAYAVLVSRAHKPSAIAHTCDRPPQPSPTCHDAHELPRLSAPLAPSLAPPAGVPTKISWKPFYSNLPPPALRGPGGFGDLPPLRKNRVVKVGGGGGGGGVVASTGGGGEDGPSDEDVEYWFKIMQEKMTTRFSELRRAFRTLDEDASGALDRDEFKQVLVMFNLGIPDRVRAASLSACASASATASASASISACLCLRLSFSRIRLLACALHALACKASAAAVRSTAHSHLLHHLASSLLSPSPYSPPPLPSPPHLTLPLPSPLPH